MKSLAAYSTATLKKKLKTADKELAKAIKAELNCRGIYTKK